ncbi:MAG TPA: CBS domain-containing protein [Solirubrobacteraceae bacterium]|nr:CBS domain-containing protein [Solirubrobacteraceae bacterium]
MFGFEDVYDYAFGKVDWLAHNLPVEGERATPPTAGRLMRDDVVRCAPDDGVPDVLAAVEASPYPFAVVTGPRRVVLGRVPASALREAADGPVAEIMQLGPSTVRPHRSAHDVAERLAKKNLRWAIVTTPEGQLLGVASREDLERAAQAG